MLRYGIPAFRLPRKLIDRELAWLGELGVEIEYGKSLGVDFSLDDLRKDGFAATCITSGTQAGVKLNIPGEDAEGSISAVDYIRAHVNGEPIELGKRVVIIGGGFTAVDAARIAVRQGVKEVFICYRRTRDEMPAVPEEVFEAEEEGVRVMYLVAPTEIVTEGGKVAGVRFRSNVLGMASDDGRRSPEGVIGAEFVLNCDTVIGAVSQQLDEDIAGLGLETTRWHTLSYDQSTGCTPVKDVFAAGDASNGPGTVIQAVAEGKRAAVSIDKTLRGSDAVLEFDPIPVPVDPIAVVNRNGEVPIQKRVPLNLASAEQRKTGYDIYEDVMTVQQAVEEASRCLHCGCGVGCQVCEQTCMRTAWDHEGRKVECDEDACVACGMCVFRCPNHNIEMVRGNISPARV
jgi:formate dehydrogenase major subunit